MFRYYNHDVKDPLLGTRSHHPIRPELHHFRLLSYQIRIGMRDSGLTSIRHFPRYYRSSLYIFILLLYSHILFFSGLFGVESSLFLLMSFVQERSDDEEYDDTNDGADNDSC
jgi:hypothetical protein